MDNQELKQRFTPIIEGLLFIAGDEGLTLQSLQQCLEIEPFYIEEILEGLKQEYDKEERGIELNHFGDIYKLLSKPSIAMYASKLFAQIDTNTLSQSALEVLSIIAYKQPITRVEIEEIRGVGCDAMLRKLQARGLIEEAGRSEAPGRPFLYQVTQEFLDAFKLVSLDELPKLPQFNQDQNEDLFSTNQ